MPTAPAAVDWIGLYLLEDLGAGDATSDTVLGAAAQGSARLVAREPLVAAGLGHAAEVFRRLGATMHSRVADGDEAGAGTVLATVHGPARAMLAGERVALNLVGRMSGIATATRALQRALAAAAGAGARGVPGMPAGHAPRVAATRKTTPGFRAFEKEAVAVGGGDPHRAGLWDVAMVKDNHRDAAGGAAAAVARLRAAFPRAAPAGGAPGAAPGLEVVCEVESLADALAAAEAGADWLLIDNQPPEVGGSWAAEVRSRHPGVRIEASGGVMPGTIAAYAWADRVSLGWLTQKAPAKDVALDWDG